VDYEWLTHIILLVNMLLSTLYVANEGYMICVWMQPARIRAEALKCVRPQVCYDNKDSVTIMQLWETNIFVTGAERDCVD
jgi:hypothetical protein